MKHVLCSRCQTGKKLGATISIDGAVYCEECLKENFPDDKLLKKKKVEQNYDPTVCFNCSKDFGDHTLRKLGSYPVCDNCDAIIQARVLPGWVKLFFAGVIILVIFSFAWNWRFLSAYSLLKKSNAALDAGNAEDAKAGFEALASAVPEVEEFKSLSYYFDGIILLQNDKPAEAVEAFYACAELPESYNVAAYIAQAKTSAAFDSGDYRQFLKLTQQALMYDTSATTLSRVASAYSCLYVTEKADSLKDLAHFYLEKAVLADVATPEMDAYANMVEYRMTVGEVVDMNEFLKRFPTGSINE